VRHSSTLSLPRRCLVPPGSGDLCDARIATAPASARCNANPTPATAQASAVRADAPQRSTPEHPTVAIGTRRASVSRECLIGRVSTAFDSSESPVRHSVPSIRAPLPQPPGKCVTMMAPVPLDHVTALIARAEERLHRSHELVQMIGESLLLASDAIRRSRELLAQDRDEGVQERITTAPPQCREEAPLPRGPRDSDLLRRFFWDA
jgi:hypothetical protein